VTRVGLTPASTSSHASARACTGWGELDEHAILTVRSGVDADLLVDEIADWLDTRASVAR